MSSPIEFKIDQKYLKILSQNEKKLIPILLEVARRIDGIYLIQENNKHEGANFYPHDASKIEIEQAAQRDPNIFSPFTIVERSESKLVPIEFHLKYSFLLKPVCRLLDDAANICVNKSLKKYLKILANSLHEGTYQEADIAWLQVKGSNLDIIVGPHERYLDKLFFIKRAYQASLGIIDLKKTQQAKSIRDVLYTTTGERPHRITPPSIVDIQVEQCLIFGGFLSKALFSRQHLPSDSETTEKYGSRIIGYLSTIDYKFEKLIYPIFNAIFEKKFKASYSRDLLKNGNYYYVLLTAVAQQLHRYRNSRTRLRETFPILDEANSVASGITHAKHLVLKGVMDQKELEATMIAQICWIFSEWVLSKKDNIRDDYLKGDAITLNFLMRVGALHEKGGISWPNFAKIFFEMENLAVIFTRFLEEGNYVDAQEFISKYLAYEHFKPFDKSLSRIKPL